MFDDVAQYADDLRFFLMVLAGAVAFILVTLVVLTIGVILHLQRLVEVQSKVARHQVEMAQRAFVPTPQIPYPPKHWGQL